MRHIGRWTVLSLPITGCHVGAFDAVRNDATKRGVVDRRSCGVPMMRRTLLASLLCLLAPNLYAQEQKIPAGNIQNDLFPDEPFCKDCLNVTGLDEKTKLAFNFEWRINWTGELPGANALGNIPLSLRHIP